MRVSIPPAALGIVTLWLATACWFGRARPVPEPPPPPVTAADLESSPDQPIEVVLQAKSPGVIVTRAANGAIAVQIRGPSTFVGSTQPLYVIDGVPFTPGPGGVLNGISPHDIEAIRVLKNPEDIGLYGVRGGNGVILITMKKPEPPNDTDAIP